LTEKDNLPKLNQNFYKKDFQADNRVKIQIKVKDQMKMMTIKENITMINKMNKIKKKKFIVIK
jgi:hypothetical protein